MFCAVASVRKNLFSLCGARVVQESIFDAKFGALVDTVFPFWYHRPDGIESPHHLAQLQLPGGLSRGATFLSSELRTVVVIEQSGLS
jgi:hypothetical protein